MTVDPGPKEAERTACVTVIRSLTGRIGYQGAITAHLEKDDCYVGIDLGDVFTLNAIAGGPQNTSVEALPGGRFLTTWQEVGTRNGVTDGFAIRAQILNADGKRSSQWRHEE